MSTSPPTIRRTASNASSRARMPRTPSRPSSYVSTRSVSTRSSPGERPASLLASPISFKGSPTPVLPTSGPYVAPQDDETDSPRQTSNPFEGRLFGGLSPSIGRESHEFLDEVNFHSPDLNSGRRARSAARFQDHDEDEDDLYSSDNSGQSSPRRKYTSVQVTEDHDEHEDDVFLDEKRKTQPGKFSAIKKTLAPILPKRLRALYNKHPKAYKWSVCGLFSFVPLFLTVFSILVIITQASFHPPVIFSTGSLNTSTLEAGVWGFNFTRALNFTIINTSKMTVDFETINVGVTLAQAPANFMGNGSSVLDMKLGPNGDYTTFLLPVKFVYDATTDTDGSTLDVLLNGCGLISSSTSSNIPFDMSLSGQSKVFGMFGKDWTDLSIGGFLQCDKFLTDAVRIMGQLKGTQLTGK